MNLAWKELKHNKKRYLLIELTLVLLIFMVIFLSGLANGLARAVSAAIENTPATAFVISDDAENLITLSHLSEEQLSVIGDSLDSVSPLNIQRSNVNLKDNSTKLDITYFAIDPEGFLNPDAKEGEKLSADKTGIVLDESFKEEGIKLGDMIEDSSSGIESEVIGFVKDSFYGHTSVGYITFDTFNQIKTSLNPNYQPFYNAAAIKGDDTSINQKGLVVSDKPTIVNHLPGYSAEQTTIRMILWVLVVISGAILGVFFYILTIQKQKQFGVMKAIGMRMGEITGMITFQITFLALFGAVIGNCLAFIMAEFLPSSMPFYVNMKDASIVSLAFVGISVLCGLLSTLKIAKVDPLITIGGNE